MDNGMLAIERTENGVIVSSTSGTPGAYAKQYVFVTPEELAEWMHDWMAGEPDVNI